MQADSGVRKTGVSFCNIRDQVLGGQCHGETERLLANGKTKRQHDNLLGGRCHSETERLAMCVIFYFYPATCGPKGMAAAAALQR